MPNSQNSRTCELPKLPNSKTTNLPEPRTANRKPRTANRKPQTANYKLPLRALHRTMRGMPVDPPAETGGHTDEQEDEQERDPRGQQRDDEMRRQQLHDRADLAQLPHVVGEAE